MMSRWTMTSSIHDQGGLLAKSTNTPTAAISRPPAGRRSAQFDAQDPAHRDAAHDGGAGWRSSRVRPRCPRAVVIAGRGGQVVRRALQHQPALVDQHHVGAGGRHVLDQVGGDQHAGVGADLPQQFAEVQPLVGVEADGRLVEQQDLRVVDDRLGDAGPAHHAAGQRLESGVGLVGQPDPVDRPLHRGRHLGVGISLSQAMYATNSRTVNRR